MKQMDTEEEEALFDEDDYRRSGLLEED